MFWSRHITTRRSSGAWLAAASAPPKSRTASSCVQRPRHPAPPPIPTPHRCFQLKHQCKNLLQSAEVFDTNGFYQLPQEQYLMSLPALFTPEGKPACVLNTRFANTNPDWNTVPLCAAPSARRQPHGQQQPAENDAKHRKTREAELQTFQKIMPGSSSRVVGYSASRHWQRTATAFRTAAWPKNKDVGTAKRSARTKVRPRRFRGAVQRGPPYFQVEERKHAEHVAPPEVQRPSYSGFWHNLSCLFVVLGPHSFIRRCLDPWDMHLWPQVRLRSYRPSDKRGKGQVAPVRAQAEARGPSAPRALRRRRFDSPPQAWPPGRNPTGSITIAGCSLTVITFGCHDCYCRYYYYCDHDFSYYPHLAIVTVSIMIAIIILVVIKELLLKNHVYY